MGQYYIPLVGNAFGTDFKAFDRSVDGEYMVSKLMEHNWWGNPFVNAKDAWGENRLARDNAFAKKDLRDLFSRSDAWNHDLQAIVINGTKTHNPRLLARAQSCRKDFASAATSVTPKVAKLATNAGAEPIPLPASSTNMANVTTLTTDTVTPFSFVTIAITKRTTTMTKLEDFLRPTQEQLFKRLCKHFKGKTLVSKGNFVLVKGVAPVMLVSHLDTVHEEPVRDICTSADGNILMSPQGIGGDDRCGCYALVKTYNAAQVKPWLLFTCEEYIEEKGFKTAFGSFSDISVIAPALDVADSTRADFPRYEYDTGGYSDDYYDYLDETIEVPNDLPVHYASDLEIVGAQLCLLDNQSDEYRAQKLSEFKFYFYDDTNLAAIKDISVQQ